MIEKFKEAFREEAAELLTNLEQTLLELESDPRDPETISSVFRTMHTIKGSSAMFGFDDISKFTHEVESVMDLLREGAFIADRTLIDLTLRARDLITALLAGTTEEHSAEASRLVQEFRTYVSARREAHVAELDASVELPLGSEKSILEIEADASRENGGGPDGASYADDSDPADVAALETFRIRFVPAPDVLMNGTKPLLLLDELRSLGEISITALTERIPPLSDLNPECCYTGWEMTLTTARGLEALRDVFIFVENSAELSIRKVVLESGAGDVKRIGEILVDRGVTTAERIRSVETTRKRIGELLVEEQIATSDQVKSALSEQEHLKRLKEKQDLGTASIRVASEKLDALVDLVGELVTLQARMASTAQNLHDGTLSSISELFERLVSQLRDNTMSIRMLPIGSTFSRFRRVVRDLSSELGKEIELVTEGADTELDKTVIEKLNDPLVHIIRNSVDHGIELPDERAAAGKSRNGTVTLSAMHSGAYVLIKVKDDGGGLNTESIYAKAEERNIIAPGTSLSEQELFHLIFAPGFSTAKTVTSVSGRGVGMDVVKRQIDSLGGSVSVESKRGEGTAITLKIPLTLAIIEGLLVRLDREYYVVPLSVVDGCIEHRREELAGAGKGRNILTYRNEVLPYVSVRDLFDVPGPPPAIEQIVVVNALESRIGFVVDQVIGDYQTVIKPLGRMFKHVEGLSGATILGDGTVALIIDVNRLAGTAQREEALRVQRDRDGNGTRKQ